jgi:ATP/maltotriose-dependent transcriptional regulator MalT
MAEKTQQILEVMDLTCVCQSFPRLPTPLIPRDNLLKTIDLMFGDEIELVMIEGGEGLGKTTLLAEFARRHADHTFSVFIKAASRFGYV